MRENIIIVTNNPKVQKLYPECRWVEGDFQDVLVAVRDLCHRDYRPLTHPLPASIRMFYSPVRSVALVPGYDERGVLIAEQSIAQYKNTMGERKPDARNQKDYETIDETLLTAGLEEGACS